MNKKLLIAAVGAALVAGPMMAAQAAPTVYGSFHFSLDRFDVDQTVSSVNQSRELSVLNANSPRFGIKGDEDLGGGLKSIYQVESGVFEDEGTSGFSATLRNTYVGFTGSSWGTVKFGRHDTPVKDLGRAVDLFNEQVGDARNITGLRADNQTNAFDARINNMVRYDSMDMSGIRVAVAHGVPEGTPSNLRYTSASATWTSGPIYLGFGYEKHGLGTKVNGTDSEKGTRLVGKYSMGDLTLAALYEQLSDLNGKSGDDRSAWGLGASFKMANNMLKAQYYDVDKTDKQTASASTNNSNDNSGKIWAVGVDHSFSKTTMAYFAYSVASNGNGSNTIDPASSSGGHGTDGPLVSKFGGDGKVYSFGTIIKF